MKGKLKPERKVGVWLDERTAYIIAINDPGEPTIERIVSNVESRVRNPGGVKRYAHFGTTYSNEEGRKQRRQKHERERYFQKLIDTIHDADYIYLFGPGQAKEELNNKIEKDHSILGKSIQIVKAGRLTKNQMIEQVREYYISGLKTREPRMRPA